VLTGLTAALELGCPVAAKSSTMLISSTLIG
jgi:hypothetical protein